MTKRPVLLLLFLAIALGGFSAADYFLSAKVGGGTNVDVTAEKVLEMCAEESYRPDCYDREIPRITSGFSIADTFDVVRRVQDADSAYGYCHVLGHELGEREVAKDPQNWIDVIAKSPVDGICANGFFHGALIARFASGDQWALTDTQIKEAIPDMRIACEPREGFNPSPLDKAICYHGIGHLTMYVTDADVPKALDICDRVTEGGVERRGHLDVCYEGVFMQLFQPLEPEDEALVADVPVNEENYPEFCASFSTPARDKACYVEAWPMAAEQIQTPDGLMAFCHASPNQTTVEHCFNMLFHGNAQGKNFDIAKISAFCKGIPSTRRAQCFSDAGRAMLQADPRFIEPALGMCGSLEEERASCFTAIAEYATFRFNPDTEYFERLCSGIPRPWDEACYTIKR